MEQPAARAVAIVAAVVTVAAAHNSNKPKKVFLVPLYTINDRIYICSTKLTNQLGRAQV